MTNHINYAPLSTQNNMIYKCQKEKQQVKMSTIRIRRIQLKKKRKCLGVSCLEKKGFAFYALIQIHFVHCENVATFYGSPKCKVKKIIYRVRAQGVQMMKG